MQRDSDPRLINDSPRCGRGKYWKAMRCVNPESRMYEYQMFQRADGICELWEMHDEIPDDEEELEREYQKNRQAENAAAELRRRLECSS